MGREKRTKPLVRGHWRQPPYKEGPIAAAANGWQVSRVADTATSRKHPASFVVLTKTVERTATRATGGFGSYPSVQGMRSGKGSVVIGFDTEFASDGTFDAERGWIGESEQVTRRIVSYQFAAIDPTDADRLRLAVVLPAIYSGPRGPRVARLSFGKALELAITALGLHEHPLAEVWTTKGVPRQAVVDAAGKWHREWWFRQKGEHAHALPITLVAHFQNADLTAFVKVMDEQQEARLKRLSTSQQQEQPSRPQLDDETRSRIAEIEKTLAAVASQLSSSEAVKLPDGSSVRRSDLDAHSMMTRIEKQLATTAQSSAELAEAVKKRGRVVIDTVKLEQHAVKVLDARLAKPVEPSIVRVEKTLRGFDLQVTEVGTQRTVAVTPEVDRVVAKTDEVLAGVRAAERRLAALEGKVAWTAVGRMCLALLPLAATLLVLGGLTMATAHALGFWPLLNCAWSSFATAQVWWHKELIALATLAGVGGFGWLVGLGGRWVADKYRGW